MSSDIWRDRERAFEEQWALVHDAELIEKLRSQARLEEITEALAKKLEVDQPELLRRVIDLGITLETGPALLLAPWSRSRGQRPGSPNRSGPPSCDWRSPVGSLRTLWRMPSWSSGLASVRRMRCSTLR